MYADKSTTGFNLMDMEYCELVLVRDSLSAALGHPNVDAEKRRRISVLLEEIRKVCVLTKDDFKTKFKDI